MNLFLYDYIDTFTSSENFRLPVEGIHPLTELSINSVLERGTWALIQSQILQGKFIWKKSTFSYHALLMVTKYRLHVQTVRIQNSQHQCDQKNIWDIFIEARTIFRCKSNFGIYMNFKSNTYICMHVYVNIHIYFAWC